MNSKGATEQLSTAAVYRSRAQGGSPSRRLARYQSAVKRSGSSPRDITAARQEPRPPNRYLGLLWAGQETCPQLRTFLRHVQSGRIYSNGKRQKELRPKRAKTAGFASLLRTATWSFFTATPFFRIWRKKSRTRKRDPGRREAARPTPLARHKLEDTGRRRAGGRRSPHSGPGPLETATHSPGRALGVAR